MLQNSYWFMVSLHLLSYGYTCKVANLSRSKSCTSQLPCATLMLLKEMLYEVQCLKSNEDMILALARQFKQLSHEPEKFR